jgi:hypothetical protein
MGPLGLILPVKPFQGIYLSHFANLKNENCLDNWIILEYFYHQTLEICS